MKPFISRRFRGKGRFIQAQCFIKQMLSWKCRRDFILCDATKSVIGADSVRVSVYVEA